MGEGLGVRACRIRPSDLEIGSLFGGNQCVAIISSLSRVWYDSKKRKKVVALGRHPNPLPEGEGEKTTCIEPFSLIGYYLFLFRDPKRDFY